MVKQVVQDNNAKKISFDLLWIAIKRKYGYDFKEYAWPSIERRIVEFIQKESLGGIMQLIDLILNDELYFDKFLNSLVVTVTEMFRDPAFFDFLTKNILPQLKTLPELRVWIAGCATGEEAYSIAILFHEANLFKKTTFFATDIDKMSLQYAKTGIYSTDQIKKYTSNYNILHGTKDFSDYYYAKYDSATLNHLLREKVNFFQHNLVTDGVFSSFHLILCRNILIYFNRCLQNHVLSLLHESLEQKGFLCLGLKETLSSSACENKFKLISLKNKIYQKI